MRERDIREAVHRSLASGRPRSEHLVVEELGLCEGAARVDVALINGNLSGYEIKSAQDTLVRLPRQVAFYSAVLEYATVVVAEPHADAVQGHLPDWWGVSLATPSADGVRLQELRPSQMNPHPDPFSVAQLLWRDEALAALEATGGAAGLRSKPRRALWGELADRLPVEELLALVRGTLKARSSWRAPH